jgi:apolipoprotein N-acyltransferase
MGDFASGPGPTTLHVPGLPPFSPLICYEVIFPGNVTARGARPAFLLNVTNDAWFGRSPGPYQHLVAARFRAVEEGLPLARAANNGISALIDPHGRYLGTLGLDEAAALDAPLPLPLAPTLFSQWGELTSLVLCGLMLLAAFLAWGGVIPRHFAAPVGRISR